VLYSAELRTDKLASQASNLEPSRSERVALPIAPEANIDQVGVEPTTPCLRGRYSNPTELLVIIAQQGLEPELTVTIPATNGWGEIRTLDLCVMSALRFHRATQLQFLCIKQNRPANLCWLAG